ncbi:MAG: asparagine synthase (glutamine-hydrolyzing) [Myxococcota bacterium]|jgi:asparagine synthase (glutamine-hydrolysing)
MCGVFAVLSAERPVDMERVTSALSAMAHRGPDGSGQWRSRDGRVALGHVRLAVRGDTPQPMSGVGDRAGVINGELYGTDAEGLAGDADSDSARLLPLVAAHGEDCVHAMRGEFAFVVWEGSRGRLIAARDPFGVKPLFVCRSGGQLILASEIKALAAYGITLRWDEGALMALMLTGMLPQGRTLFSGIEEVPPGHRLIADHRQSRVQRWWQPVLSEPGDTTDHCDAIRAALEDAVTVRLAADRPIAVALSGGIDSSLVLAIAARKAPVMSFSVGFPGDDSSELSQAAAFAEHLSVPHHALNLSEASLADHYASTVRAVESPLVNTHAVARSLLARAVRAESRVVLLTGDGGDELFGGYPHFLQDALRAAGDRDGLQRLQRSVSGTGRLLLAREDADGDHPGSAALPGFIRARLASGRALRQLLSREVLSRWDETEILASVMESLELPAELAERGPVERAMNLWSASVLPRYLLPALGDRVELAHGVEGRVPLLDVRLAALAGRLPEDQRVRGSTDKWALREAARGLLPESLRTRPKHAFLAPSFAAQVGPMHDLLHDTLRGSAGRELPCFSPLRVEMLLDLALPVSDPSHAAELDPALNLMLSLALLSQELKVSV